MLLREPGNSRDPFVAAVVKSDQTVGHVPLKISSVCSFYCRLFSVKIFVEIVLRMVPNSQNLRN